MDAQQKRAFLGSLARAGGGLLRGGLNFGKGMLMMGPTAKAGLAGKAMNVAGKAYGVAAPVMGAMSTGQNGATFMGMGGPKTGSLALDMIATKVARLSPGDLADIASYGSFIGAKLVPHDNPWHKALDAAGLIGLGATTAHSLATNPADRGPSGKDLLGLALMGSALYDRHKAHGH